MSPQRVHKLFAAALVTSVILHAALLMLIGRAIERSQWEQRVAQARHQPTIVPVELTLGIDAPNPPTETWIGFEEEVPQQAPPAEVEQAALTAEPVAASPALDEVLEPAPTPAAPVEVAEALPEPPQPTPESEAVAENQDQPTPDQPDDVTEPEPATSPPPPAVKPSEIKQDLLDWLTQMSELFASAATAPPHDEDMPATQPSHSPPSTQPSTTSATPVSPPPASEQPIGQPPATPVTNDAIASDRDSDPSSIIEVPRDLWELGRPIAAHGLELKPRRPHLTVLTMLTAAPCNPLCEITFGRDGVPSRARLITGSCDSRVDAAILNSLYAWRASGERLKKLQDGETVNIGIRLILSRRK
jgi:hypothetical protein